MGTGRITTSTGSTGSSIAGTGKGSSGARKVSNNAPTTGNKPIPTVDQLTSTEAEQGNTSPSSKTNHPNDTQSTTTTTTNNNNNNQVTTTNTFSLSSIFPPAGYPSIPGLPSLLPPPQYPHFSAESSHIRGANPHNPPPSCVDPAALEAARFVHLVSSASVLTLQVTLSVLLIPVLVLVVFVPVYVSLFVYLFPSLLSVLRLAHFPLTPCSYYQVLIGAGGLAALVHMISFSVLISSQQETNLLGVNAAAVAAAAAAIVAQGEGGGVGGGGGAGGSGGFNSSYHSVASASSANPPDRYDKCSMICVKQSNDSYPYHNDSQ